MCVCVCVSVLTDAIVSEVSCQALFLILGIILSLPGLVLFTGQTCMLRLPLQRRWRNKKTWQIPVQSRMISVL